MSLSYVTDRVFQLIYLILIVAIFLTWIPSINWQNQPFRFIRQFAEIFFAPFRRLVPPIGMFDISPIVCFLFLEVLRQLLLWVLGNFGL